MSRAGDYDDYDEKFPNEGAFWHKRAQTARKSKRGKQALRDLREALLALPEKRLVEGALSTVRIVDRARDGYEREDAALKVSSQGEGVCAVGAYIWHKRVKEGMTPDEAFDSLPILLDSDSGLYETARAGEEAGLTYTLASILADINDESFRHYTPESRYAQFLAWIELELAT